MWYYMSFANNEEFLGALIIEADNEFDMMIKSHLSGHNPGGEIQFLTIPEEAIDKLPDKYKDRLLTREEVEEMDRVMLDG